MSTAIAKILNNKNITYKEIANKSNVPASTLRKSVQKPIESWSIRVLNAFAVGLDEQPGDLLNMLQPKVYTLEIDNDNQIIQGVYIADKETYQQIRGVVEACHLEGWNPTKDDIQYLLNESINPDPETLKRIDEIWGNDDE